MSRCSMGSSTLACSARFWSRFRQTRNGATSSPGVDGIPLSSRGESGTGSYGGGGTVPPKAKPNLTIEVYKKKTRVRKKETWGVRIKAGNHLTLFASEKYVNHSHALNAANLVADGEFTVVDELA